MHTSSGLVCSSLGKIWCCTESCKELDALYKAAMVYIPSRTYLESSAHAEDAVVGLPL
jgi:hypothetical protein